MENPRQDTVVSVPQQPSQAGERFQNLRRLSANGASRMVLLMLSMMVGRYTNAQESAPLPVDIVLRMKFLGRSLRDFSPDGKWIAYTVSARLSENATEWGDVYTRTGVSPDAYGMDLLVINTSTRKARVLSGGQGSSWMPAWSPNGRYLAFLSDRDGAGQAKLWVWDTGNDSIRKVSDVIVRMPGPQQIQWLPNNEGVAITVLPESLSPAMPGPLRPSDSPVTSKSTVTVYSSTAADGTLNRTNPFSLEYLRHDLAIVNIADGRVARIISGQWIATYRVIENGHSIVFSGPLEFERSGSQQILYKISTYSIATKTERVLANGIRLGSQASFTVSPDEALLCYRVGGPAENVMDFYVVDLASGNLRNLTQFNPSATGILADKSPWRNSSNPLWSQDGSFLYYTVEGALWRTAISNGASEEVAATKGHYITQLASRKDDTLWTNEQRDSTLVIMRNQPERADAFYLLNLGTGAATKLREDGECYTCEMGINGHLFDVSDDGRWVAYTAENARHPGDIWLADAGFRTYARLTTVNAQVDDYRAGPARLISWNSDDGEHLQGALLLPPGFVEGKQYPMVVLVYGGLHLSDWFHRYGGFDRPLPYLNVQLLATRGYIVFMPDAPQHLGTPMLDLAKTVLPGVNRVVEMGIADPGRIGVMGHSYGGYSVLSLIAQTHRFKAAIELNGTGSLLALYGAMNKDGSALGASLGETGQSLTGGSPWVYRDRYIENSPIFYLDRVETPLLILHGSEDHTVAAFLGDEVFVGLRRLNKVVEYAKYEGEGHEFVSHGNQLDAATRIIRWFDTYLK